jgi:hypothetical protein
LSHSIGGGLFIYISGKSIDSGVEEMQPIVHFLLSLVAGLGVGLHLENKAKKYLLISLLALSTACIDLDHILPIYQETGVKIFHNFFVFVLIPSALFFTFYVKENKKSSTIGQRACMLLSVMFLGHMFLDGASGTMPFFYPFRSEMFTMSNIGITIEPTLFTLTSLQVVLILWGAVIIGANLLENIIYRDVEGSELFDLDLNNKPQNKERKSLLPSALTMIFLKMKILLPLKDTGKNSKINSDS